jgi:GNAT superfamily N-acetyltransferase
MPNCLQSPIYPRVVSFKKGKRLLLRFLNLVDLEEIVKLFLEALEDDLCWLKEDFRDPRVGHRWLEELRQRRVLALAAVDLQEHRFAAGGHLRLGRDSARHVGEIRLFVSAPFRGLGLGSLLLRELRELALDEDLKWLQTEVVARHREAVNFFQAHGFEVNAVLKDYFLRHNGETHDVALMLHPVMQEFGKFSYPEEKPAKIG